MRKWLVFSMFMVLFMDTTLGLKLGLGFGLSVKNLYLYALCMLLLIDAAMSQDDACATIEQIYEHLGPDVVVIGLMTAGREDAREACLGQGAADVIGMPCDPLELSEVLSRHLRGHVE